MLNAGARRLRIPRSAQRGLSLIEMMVGITIGMIVVAGASLMMTNQVAEHRRLVLETQVQQDLRATADLMLRDLRRAGFWATPERGVWAPGAAMPASSPYAGMTPAANAQDQTELLYSYSRSDSYTLPSPSEPEDQLLTSREAFGFRISNGVLQSLLGGSWQPLTDPNTLTVTRFSVDLTVQPISLASYCSPPCLDPAVCPVQQIRSVRVVISGHAKHDDKTVRTISLNSRIRNDRVGGSCPS